MSVRILALALVGCGRIAFDAPVSDATSGDADAAPCTFGAWSTPVAIAELNTPATEYGGEISLDGLTLYFDSDRTGNEDLLLARRPDRQSPFGSASPLGSIDTLSDETDPTLTADQLELLFHRVTGGDCIADSRRSAPTDGFLTAVSTGICNANGAFVTRDGLTLYYNLLEDGAGEGTLMMATRASTTDLFAPGSPIPELMAGANKGYPALSGDGLALVFESAGGGGDLDLYIATRTGTTEPWGTPVPIAEVNSAFDDGDASLTDDGTELFFESRRAGSPDLYHATRACL
jgi:Tol biopolymer transport system component